MPKVHGLGLPLKGLGVGASGERRERNGFSSVGLRRKAKTTLEASETPRFRG